MERVAAQQGGVIRRTQLLDHGVSAWALRRAVDERLLRRVAPGLFVTTGSSRNRTQELWIAHMALGPSSVVSHESAGRLWGLQGVLESRPTLTVPHGSNPRMSNLCRSYQSRHLGALDVTRLDDLPMTTAARTVVDLATVSGSARLGSVLDSAHDERLASVSDVGAALLRVGVHGRPGIDRLIKLLDDRSDGAAQTQSKLERQLGKILAMADITDFTRQYPLPTDGSYRGWVDVYVALAKLIIEADGRRWHRRQADMLRDRDRDLRAAEHGLLTVRFMHEQLRDRPEECAERLTRVVASRQAEAAA